ncbi:RNA polymerase recycling motor HelD [Aquibacillus salsiterrae]|uniref:DNA 3'-5' helicase n=1 Tax=Aquibacillus salsiterrae TaxID=2950439 RepID=A0A9X3WCC3_9BACI|nr:RNA polymerase recycling motor HelD [Aquibacillus salsiterrae]MDC3416847.1 AAA family ATPase [Aquibacillus salsiterrae]
MDPNDKEWISEQDRVNKVVEEVKNKIVKLSERTAKIKDRVIDIRKNFWEDVTVNLDEPDDIIETQASLKQQAEFLSERERSHGQLSEQLKTLERLEDSPYFGRIDFKEEGEKDTESIYIGISSLMDKNEDDFLIYDWRAPISSLYYDYPPGKAQFEAVDQTIHGEIEVKRQYIIRNAKIKGMFDTGLTIGDHLLQSVLGNNANTQMKSIVATIQREQNQIIRNEKSDLLVVQGVAGSGKTSAALQRVAYLLYRYREMLTADNIVLFSPNPLFNSYVATVLPELGEENMKQTTFHQYLDSELGKQFTIETPFEQMEFYLNGSGDTYADRVQGIGYKAGLDFKRLLEDFVSQLGEKGIQFRNLTFRGKRIITKIEIENYFYRLDDNLSIPNRMELVSKWLLGRLKEMEQAEQNKDWVLEETELLGKDEYLDIHQQLQDENMFTEDTFDDFLREEYLLRKRVVSKKLKPLKQKVKRLFFVDIKKTYTKLYVEKRFAPKKVHQVPSNWDNICKQTVINLQDKYLTWEDATPFLYFKKLMLGFNANRLIQHLFIDEAQDYSPLQFAFLRKMFPSSRVTLLGDINQAIYAHAIHEETLLSDKMKEKHERITLTRSYRSTKPIVEFTKSFMEHGHLIEPFNREGEKPQLVEVESTEILNEKIVQQINEYQETGYETIAIITKTMKEAKFVYQWLSNRLEVKIMDEAAHTFQKGLLIIPAYLAKGIEFDAVIIHNASKSHYNKELERNLFYTACTRAMHDLSMFSLGQPSPFIEQISKDKFKHYKVHAIQKSNR